MSAGAADMTMAIRITAAGTQALAVIGQVNRAIKGTSEMGARMGRTAAATGKAIGGAFSLALAPARMLATATLGLSLVFGGLSAKALSASGDMEALRMRMEGVTDSVATANRLFAETEELSIKSPFTPQELVDARIGLINIGQMGSDAINAIGDAAAITQRPLGDLVSVLASMETEPLRRIGIELKRESGTFSFAFRDRMQTMQTIVAKGVDEARAKLLSIFENKYGGGMAKFASAWKGLTSTLQGNLAMAASRFGDGLMPTAKRFVDGLNQRLTALIESGKLTEWGAKAGELITAAWDRAEAVIGFARDVISGLRETPGAMAQGLAMVLGTGGQILATNFVMYLQAMSEVFVGLAKLMSAAFLEDILQAPFMRNTRLDMMTSNMRDNPEEVRKLLKEMGLPYQGGGLSAAVVGRWKMSKEQEAKLAVGGRRAELEAAAMQTPGKLAALADQAKGSNTEMMRKLQDDLTALAGGNIKSVAEREADIKKGREESERAAQLSKLVTVFVQERPQMISRNGVSMLDAYPPVARYHMTRDSAKGLKDGQEVNAGTIINIAGDFVGTFTDFEMAERQIRESSGKPAFGGWGGY